MAIPAIVDLFPLDIFYEFNGTLFLTVPAYVGH
jgi:hypothetical protein